MMNLNETFIDCFLEQLEAVPADEIKRVKDIEGVSGFVAKLRGVVSRPSFRTYAVQVGKFNVDLSKYNHQNPIYRIKIHDPFTGELVYAGHVNEGARDFKSVASTFQMVDWKYSEAERVRMERARSRRLKNIASRLR